MVAALTTAQVDSLLRSPEVEELLLRNDLAYFAEKILGMEVVAHHRKWSELAAKYNRLCINCARDHGKSFFFAHAYVIWRAYYKWLPDYGDSKSLPKFPIGYIWSNTEQQAIDHLTLVQQEILSNPKLRFLVPPGKGVGGMPAGWSKKRMRLSNGVSIRAIGWGGRVRGAHPVWAVFDDILNDETIYSELVRRKQIDYFYSAATPSVVPGGQIIVVGTPFHQEDLYAELKKNPEYVFARYPALSQDEKERPLWPTRYSKEILLRKRREVGQVRFAREYMCVPISDESSLFPERIIVPCFEESFRMPTHLTAEDLSELQVYTGVDLAMSANVGADWTAIITIGIDRYKNIWLLNIRRFKGKGLTEQLKAIQDVYNSFKPRKIWIEDNNFQRIFKDELVRNTNLPVQGYNTHARRKNSVEEGVPSMQILFENRKFVIARATAYDREITDQLIGELKAFSWMDGKLQGVGSHDDMVMALWIALEASREGEFQFSFA